MPSPDGSRIVSWGLKGTDVYSIDGGEPLPVPGVHPAREWPVQWRTDGRAIYFVRSLADRNRVDEVDLATGRHLHWKDLLYPDPLTSAPRNVRITPDGQAYAFDVWSTPSTLYLVKGLH
jgi:Tol biopolymer transport system component